MNHPGTATRTGPDETLSLSLLLRLLSQAFAYPSPPEVARLVGEDVPLAVATAGGLPEEMRRELSALERALGGETAGGLEERYLDVFGHVHSGDCPMYETDYGPRDVWRQSNELADIAGFYRAFGFDPKGERPDHVAVELEFLHVLTYKRSWAEAHEDASHAGVCREAAEAFLRDHVLRWLPSFAARVEALATDGPYLAAARLSAAYCRAASGAAGPREAPMSPGGAVGPGDEPRGFCEDEP